MQKTLRLILVALIFSTLGAYAKEMVARSRSDCNDRCNKGFSDPEDNPRFGEKVIKIRAAKLKETDPEKLKELSKLEQEELKKYLDIIEKNCNSFCQYLPE